MSEKDEHIEPGPTETIGNGVILEYESEYLKISIVTESGEHIKDLPIQTIPIRNPEVESIIDTFEGREPKRINWKKELKYLRALLELLCEVGYIDELREPQREPEQPGIAAVMSNNFLRKGRPISRISQNDDEKIASYEGSKNEIILKLINDLDIAHLEISKK